MAPPTNPWRHLKDSIALTIKSLNGFQGFDVDVRSETVVAGGGRRPDGCGGAGGVGLARPPAAPAGLGGFAGSGARTGRQRRRSRLGRLVRRVAVVVAAGAQDFGSGAGSAIRRPDWLDRGGRRRIRCICRVGAFLAAVRAVPSVPAAEAGHGDEVCPALVCTAAGRPVATTARLGAVISALNRNRGECL